MKIIVALGNPGKKYEYNRHNAGFLALDFFLKSLKGAAPACTKFSSELVEASMGAKKIFFIKPQTFMNNSGEAALEVVSFYKADVSKDLLVIHDEIDLPFGTIRTTDSSSPAGHNGVKNIIEKLGTQDFHRIRIGVESRASRDEIPTEAFVLQNFREDELKKLQSDVFLKVKNEIEKFVSN